MATTNDIFKQVYYNDGEGLTYPDSIDAQNFLSARLNDQLFEKLVPGLSESVNTNKGDFELSAENGTDSNTGYCYALAGGQAYLAPGSANNKVKITPGTLFQKVGSADGNSASFLAYTFTGAEEVTIAVGDPTNPRVDLIEMQLSYVTDDPQTRDFQDATTHVITTQSVNKKRQVQCTLQVKAGTPASTPVYPTVDSGFVIVGAVRVEAAEAFSAPIDNLSASQTQIQDHRFPLNVRVYTTYPGQMHPVTAFALTGGFQVSSSGTNTLIAYCPDTSQGSRLLGVQISTEGVTTGTVEVGGLDGSLTVLANARNELASALTSNTAVLQGRLVRFKEFQANCYASDNGVANASADGFGPPLWCSGLRSIGEINKSQTTWSTNVGLAIKFTNVDNGLQVGKITWYVAG